MSGSEEVKCPLPSPAVLRFVDVRERKLRKKFFFVGCNTCLDMSKVFLYNKIPVSVLIYCVQSDIDGS